MASCAAINCSNALRKGYRMHRFPSDELRARFWAEQSGRATDWNPSRIFHLCEVHFDEKQYELHRADGRKLLRWNAVPTIFNFDESMTKLAKKRRKKKCFIEKDSSEVNDTSNSENLLTDNVSHIHETKQDYACILNELVMENICELSEVRENEITFSELDIASQNIVLESDEILNDVTSTSTLHRISSKNLSHKLDPLWEDISCNLHQSAADVVSKSAKKTSRTNRKKNDSRKKFPSRIIDASNSKNIHSANVFHNIRKTEQDHSYVLREIASENVGELNEDAENEVPSRKRKLTTKSTSCESNEILDNVTYTLHKISSENLSQELDHLREDISCNLYHGVDDSARFEIENVPCVLNDDGGEKDCSLNECRKGCTHTTIIENYRMRILELEDKLASMEVELNATKAKLQTKRRRKTS